MTEIWTIPRQLDRQLAISIQLLRSKYSSLSRKLGKLVYLFVEAVVRLSPKRKPGKFAIGFSSLGFRFSTESYHVRHAVGLY